MVLLYWPYGNVYDAWRTLERLYEAGKIRAIGISNFDVDRMIDLITFNKINPCINQIETHLFLSKKIGKRVAQKIRIGTSGVRSSRTRTGKRNV